VISVKIMEVMDAFKAKSGVSTLIATLEGELGPCNVEGESPQVLAAMLATVYGAGRTAMDYAFSENQAEVLIIWNDFKIMLFPRDRSIVATFIPDNSAVGSLDVKEFIDSLM